MGYKIIDNKVLIWIDDHKVEGKWYGDYYSLEQLEPLVNKIVENIEKLKQVQEHFDKLEKK